MIFLLASLLTGAAPLRAERDDETPKPKAASAEQRRDDDDDDEERAQPDTPIVVTARRLDAARTRIDAALGASVYSLENETIENRPGGETGSIAAILAQAPGTGIEAGGLTIRGSRAVQVRIN